MLDFVVYSKEAFSFIISLLYPKKCVGCRTTGNYICSKCFSEISFLQYQYCAICQKGSIDGLTHPKCKTQYAIDGIISSISYRGIIKNFYNNLNISHTVQTSKLFLENYYTKGLFNRNHLINSFRAITCG